MKTLLESLAAIPADARINSLDIAEQTGKSHETVMVDIYDMLVELELDPSEFAAAYTSDTGQRQGCFNLRKREYMTLITGYSPELFEAILERVQELERKEAEAAAQQRQLTMRGRLAFTLKHYSECEAEAAVVAAVTAAAQQRRPTLADLFEAAAKTYPTSGINAIH